MAYTTVFVVSDGLVIRDSLSELITSAGLCAETFPSLEMWLEAAPSMPRGCLVLDAQVWDKTRPDGLARLTEACGRLPIILLVDRGDVPTAVRAIKEGAVDILEKPLRGEYLLERIKMAVAVWQDVDATG
jgi:FixJ family two-component response regulator